MGFSLLLAYARIYAQKDPDLLLQKYVSFAVENDTIIVASINKYGICENNLRVFITDEKNNRYSVHISGEDNLKIDICPISITDEINDYDIYRWFSFEDDDKTMGKLTLIRVGCLLFAICYFCIIGIFSIIVKRVKSENLYFTMWKKTKLQVLLQHKNKN